MGIWLELRCERRTDTEADGHEGERCWSLDNVGPMAEASDTRAAVVATLQGLEREGRAQGWKKTREGWVCPHCVKAGAPASDK